MAKFQHGRVMGRCEICKRRLMVNPETSHCLTCENAALKEKVELLEFQLEASNKKNRDVWRKNEEATKK